MKLCKLIGAVTSRDAACTSRQNDPSGIGMICAESINQNDWLPAHDGDLKTSKVFELV
jgi:hypothetical protein